MASDSAGSVGGQVSTEAEVCPHCGVRAPAAPSRRILGGAYTIGGLFLLGLLWLIASLNNPSNTTNNNSEPPLFKAAVLKWLREDYSADDQRFIEATREQW
jgi:hypothetical protein